MAASPREFSFSGTIAPTRLSAAYRAGLVFVAAAMLLLPLLYVGVIGVTGAAVWWHLTEHSWLLGGKGGGQWRLMLYLAPAIAGAVLVFFMIKPILAPRSKREEVIEVDPASEPSLFALTATICRQVGAPMPKRIQVDCQVNASAAFNRGALGMLGNNLVLTIGLPLVAGLTIRQLSGVLAHEFGHFAQGGGMRLTALVRGINFWFGRVVYERDSWDQKLEHWSRNAAWQVSLLLVIARGAVWLTRQLLSGLMWSGHAISCFMLRQMEFDADSYEVKIAGSQAFARTSTRMREMNLAAQLGYSDLRESLRKGTLPSHLPAFVVQRCERLPAEWRNDIGRADAERTAWFDTHPSDASRIAAASRTSDAGVLQGGDGPATALFRRFDALSAAATRRHYEQDLGIRLEPITLIDTDAAIRQSLQSEKDWLAIRQLFGDSISAYRPLPLSRADVHLLDRPSLLTMWSAAHAATAGPTAGVNEQYREFEALESKRDKAFAAQELLRGGFGSVVAADFDLTAGTMEETVSVLRTCEEQQQALTPPLQAFEASGAVRLLAAIRLQSDVPVSEEVMQLIDAYNALASVVDRSREIRRLDFAFALLEQNASQSPQPEAIRTRLTETAALVANRVETIRSALATVASPSAIDPRRAPLSQHCGLEANGQSASTGEVIDRIYGVYFEVLGRLAALAVAAEVQLTASGSLAVWR
jgi:Zn-dependent protease with chaperone function